jgi:tetratricopeptide (TPR) repeat protein
LDELSRNLDQRFALLTGGSRTALPRHRTLRSLIDWSYDLLSDSERAMLRRASVFSGGWTLEAAQEVCRGDAVEVTQALDLLTSLADKNLISAETKGDATRYGLLESVRHYARDRLRELGEEEHVQRQLLAYFLPIAEQAAKEQSGAGANQKAWLDRLESERDNLRAVLSWAVGPSGDAESGLQLAGSLRWFWSLRGYFREGRDSLSALLAVASGERNLAAQARAHHGIAVLAAFQFDLFAAKESFEMTLAVWKELGDRPRIGSATCALGQILLAQGDYEAARPRFEEALAIGRETDSVGAIIVPLGGLAILAREAGDFAAARRLLEERSAAARQFGNPSALAFTLYELGSLALAEDDYAAARSLLQEGLALARQARHEVGVCAVLAKLGMVAQIEGDHRTALVLLKEALTIQRGMGGGSNIAESLEALAPVVLALVGPGPAAVIWGRAQRIREEAGAPQLRSYLPNYNRNVAAARDAMADHDAFDKAWNEGRAMGLVQGMQYALDVAPT